MSMDNENRLLNGALKELIEAADEIGDRKYVSPTKARAVEDVAVDPWRIACSGDYRETLAFLNGTKQRARELTERINRHLADYDRIDD